MPELTVKDVKDLYPDVHAAILQEGYDKGLAEGTAKGLEDGIRSGAEKERSRIQAVEGVIAKADLPDKTVLDAMKYDGSTTAEQAAMRVLNAQDEYKKTALQSFKDEHKTVVDPADPKEKVETKKDFMSLVADYQQEHTCSKAEAIRAVAKTNPEAHEDYVASLRPKTKKED